MFAARRGKLRPAEARTSPLTQFSHDPLATARQRTEERSRFVGQLFLLGAVLLFFAFTAGIGEAVTIGLLTSIFFARRAYRVFIAPELERRWFEEALALERAKTSAAPREQGSRKLEMLSASIAHEIRNPITAAKSLVAQMADAPEGPDNEEYAKVVLEELDRVERAISNLLRYAREEPMSIEATDLGEVVDSALESFRDRLTRDEVKIVRHLDGPVTVEADPEKLRRVVINLVTNALDAMAEAGTNSRELRVAAGHNLAQDGAWLSVRDNGPGIEEDRIARIFEPFHTSKASGTGLGLAIARKLAEAHGGSLDVTSARGQGTDMVLTLPRRGSARR